MVLIRPARKADAEMIARLGDRAGEGIPSYLWSAAAAPGKSTLAVDIRRAVARRPVAPYPDAPHQGDWVLMTKAIG